MELKFFVAFLFPIETAIKQALYLGTENSVGFCITENLIEERSFLTIRTEVAFFHVNFINGTAV
jgi:hypothetical protein